MREIVTARSAEEMVDWHTKAGQEHIAKAKELTGVERRRELLLASEEIKAAALWCEK